MNEQMCAHLHIEYHTIKNLDGSTFGWWQCDDCEVRFVPMGTVVYLQDLAELKAENVALQAKYDAASFWSDWVYPEGAKPEDIHNELADFKDMINRFEHVLEHATGGRMSKATYKVEQICSVIDEYYGEQENE